MAGYNIYRSDSVDGYYVKIAEELPRSPHDLINHAAGVWWYRMSYSDDRGESELTEPISQSVIAAPAPISFIEYPQTVSIVFPMANFASSMELHESLSGGSPWTIAYQGTASSIQPAKFTVDKWFKSRGLANNSIGEFSAPIKYTQPVIGDLGLTYEQTGVNSVVIRWNNVGLAYNVYRGEALVVGMTTDTSFTDTGVIDTTVYRIEAFRGHVTRSSSITFFPVMPGAPTGFNYSAIGDQVTFSWDTTIEGATSYKIYRSVTGANGDYIHMTDAVTSPKVITGNIGTSHYRISAITALGETSLSVPISVTIMDKPDIPSTVNGTGTVHMTVQIPTGAISMFIEWRNKGASTWNIWQIPEKGSSSTVIWYDTYIIFNMEAFNTDREYRTYGITGNSKSSYSDVYTYIQPILGSLTANVTQLSATQVKVDWTISSGNPISYTVTFYVDGVWKSSDIFASSINTHIFNLTTSAEVRVASRSGFVYSPVFFYNFVRAPLPDAPTITGSSAIGQQVTLTWS